MKQTVRTSRTRAALTAIALTAGLTLVAAAPASADTNTYADAVGEEGTTPATDLTAYRLTLNTSFSVGVWTSAALPSDANVSIELDTNEDQNADFTVEKFGTTWYVYDSLGASRCSTTGTASGNAVFFTVPASCIDSPAQVRAAVWILGSDDSFDFAPPFTEPYFSAPVSAGPDVSPTTNPQVVVYRFWSQGFNNAHFFTTNEIEALNIVENDGNWQYEGAAFSAVAATGSTCPEGSPVYRFYSPVFQSHFYTQNENEKNAIIAGDRNWKFEGTAYCAYPQQTAGTVPLYRFWSPKFGKHFYTANQGEASNIIANDRNWSYENIAYYVIP